MGSAMNYTIDAHQHFWQLNLPFDYGWLDSPNLAEIRRDFLPSDLEPLIRAEGVGRTIFVQTQHDLEENRWVLGLAEQHPFIAGVVGWVDLASKECERQVFEFCQSPKFVGVRHIVQDEPDDDFLIRDEIRRGLKVLEKHEVPFDLLLYVKHLRHVPTLARALPGLPMVIDHLAKPRIKDRAMDDWLPGFREAASFPNVCCKLSGMVTEADWGNWTADDLRPYVHHALDFFGPDRLMFGSDWPVCELAATYGEVHEALVGSLGPISKSERQAIFGGTAARFYGIEAPPAG
jgi:L-fuconolactonase